MAKKKKQTFAFNVSQSMIKDVRKFVLKKMCGLVLQAKYITKAWPVNADDSPAKKLGRYFEYILTGSTGRDGEVPQPEFKKSAIAKNKRDPLRNRLQVSDMKKEYQLAHKNATRVKRYFKTMKIKILEVNIRFEKNGMEGTIDIIAMYKGRRVVIDVKYSGLIHDKRDELGWVWTDEQKRFHGVQALQYHTITSIPFYFLVVSSTNDEDILFLEPVFDEFSLEQHEVEVADTRKKMEFYIDFGFNPVPELKRCERCPLAEACEFKMLAPEPKLVTLASRE